MKRLVTFLLLSQLFVNVIIGQVPMAVSGDVTVATGGILYSKGDVNIRATAGTSLNGRVDNKGSIIAKEDMIFYSNTERDGLLKNAGTNNVTKEAGKIVGVRKLFPVEFGWYTISFPFDVKVEDVIYSDGTSAKYDGTRTNSTDDDFWVAYYNADRRTEEGVAEGNWTDLDDTFDTFVAGTAYRISIKHKDSMNEMIFPASDDEATEFLSTKDKQLALTYYGENLYEDDNSNGWAVIGGLYPTSFTLTYDNVEFIGSGLPAGTGAIYTYDHATKKFTVLPVGTPSRVLTPYTTFYVKINETTTGMKYNSANLTLDNAYPVGFRSSQFITRDILTLYLTNLDNQEDDIMNIVFDDLYSESYIPMEDARKLSTKSTSYPYIWSINDTEGYGAVDLSINRMPLIENDDKEIKLGVAINKAGRYAFSLDIESDLMRTVTLLDKKTGETTDLMLADYEFDINTTEIIRDRFVLFANKAPTSIDEIKNNIYANVDNNLLTVYNVPVGSNVQVIDLNGRMVVSGISKDSRFSTQLNAKGVYVVKINGEDSKVLKVLNK